MKRALLLSASYGEGHNAAARNLRAGFEEIGVQAEVYDPLEEAYGHFYWKTRHAYLQLIERLPNVWAAFFEFLDRTPTVHLTVPLLGRAQKALRKALEERKPQAVISTYPLYSYLIDRLYPDGKRPFEFSTVVTDSITINSVWMRRPSDRYFVPNEVTAAVMEKAGVKRQLLCTYGFPVPLVFGRNGHVRPTPSAAEPLRVLFMINAGRKQAPALVRRLLKLEGISLTVTVGKDAALQGALESIVKNSGKTAQIHGWTPNMPELLMTHHVLIGKAGGAAVQETIAARTPMLITKVVPGQEEGNARLMLEAGCGAICETEDAICGKLAELVANEGALWSRWHEAITKISQPDAALHVARAVAERMAG